MATLNVTEEVRNFIVDLKNSNREKYHSVDEVLRERFKIK